MKPRFSIFSCRTNEQVRDALKEGFETFGDVLPARPDALILIKPNLNSHMNALAGNTSDLRILVGCVKELQARGYTNIVIGEGTNSGFYRNQISVITRLRVDRLAELLGVKSIDLNYAEGMDIEFDRGLKAQVARICSEADLFINIPKIKTHFEAGITVCLKNLIGCMVSQENKKKVHNNLPRNIVNINRAIKPHLHIIDGLIAMEGNGPTRGEPINFGKMIMGDNAFALDYLCSRLMQIPAEYIDYLTIALDDGLISPENKQFIDDYPIDEHSLKFAPAKSNLLVSLIFNHKLQRYFQRVRATKFFTWLCSTSLGGKVLFKSGIRQDVFVPEEMNISCLTHDSGACQSCGKCKAYYPAGRDLPGALDKDQDDCLQCLYCYLVCPEGAIGVDGELGFFHEQVKQFGSIIKRIV